MKSAPKAVLLQGNPLNKTGSTASLDFADSGWYVPFMFSACVPANVPSGPYHSTLANLSTAVPTPCASDPSLLLWPFCCGRYFNTAIQKPGLLLVKIPPQSLDTEVVVSLSNGPQFPHICLVEFDSVVTSMSVLLSTPTLWYINTLHG